MRKVLSVASECAPLVKTGGLADVAGALPSALAAEGWHMRTLLPGYPAVMKALKRVTEVWHDADLMGGPARVLAGKTRGLDMLVLDAPHLFDRPGSIYLGPDGLDWPDNPERFAALSRVAAEIAVDGAAGWKPEVLHLHDWQAALVPVYLRALGATGEVATLLTVHNIAFHGLAPAEKLEALNLPEWGFTHEGFEYYGKINALKAGLVYADMLSTVSPTYARELMRPQFGMGLDGVLRARAADLVGILNGIDETVWNPETDKEIAGYRTPKRKAANTLALAEEFDLPPGDGPLAVVVSRLTEQKGLDLLLEALPAYCGRGGRLALLGSGDKALETAWLEAARDYPNVGVRIGYDEALSHRMIGGGDAIVIPSRFEPCGLTQLYGLRYGTVPVVALTGGLADTVINANDAALSAGVATGIQFYPVTAQELTGAMTRLCDLFAQRKVWSRMQRKAMKQHVGWGASAPRYAALYEKIGSVE
ncbi:glycogen synthase GlgA [Oricola cellulosilytica]|uniref:Glycogen synthase n=1 Tax=Oricola cellulosilytica TaxID=1429082 RepID=A0A4R0PGU2_9HYPH|nr:glycogen synthase GlgA [Oricola cellulosilytica]TCD16268.1 glycogen synthase GlgA [Oricola cellulosilytica]